MHLDRIQEVENFVEARVRQDQHVLRHGLNQRQKTAFGVEPRICAQLLLEGLEGLDNATHAKVVVALGAVQSANHQVDNAKVVDLLGGFFESNAFFLLLNALHELFCIRILRSHNVGDAQVGKHDGRDGKKFVHLSTHEWLVISDRVTILVILHEENVGNIKFPSFVFGAKLGRLSEYLLHHGIAALIPVHLRLHHQHGDVVVQGRVILLQGLVDGFGVALDTRILNRFRLLAQRINVLVRQIFKLFEGLFFAGLVKNEVLQKFEVFRGEALVGEMCIFGENVGRQIVMLILAVEEYQVGEGLRGERRVVQQEVQLFETGGRVLFDVHQGGVVQRHRIQLVFVSRRHVHEGLSSCN